LQEAPILELCHDWSAASVESAAELTIGSERACIGLRFVSRICLKRLEFRLVPTTVNPADGMMIGLIVSLALVCNCRIRSTYRRAIFLHDASELVGSLCQVCTSDLSIGQLARSDLATRVPASERRRKNFCRGFNSLRAAYFESRMAPAIFRHFPQIHRQHVFA
jgi:hypothetical protein